VSFEVRPATAADAAQWLRMRAALWPDGSAAEHAKEIAAWLAGPDTVALVAARMDSDDLVGLAELSLRPYADGCEDSPVAYLEGWWVDPAVRRQGLGRALIEAASDWARARGGTELASDAQLDNLQSQRAHAALGFAEAGRAVLYVRRLDQDKATR
jgi:aminoglycoside 6'-N-acetyltransferase I